MVRYDPEHPRRCGINGCGSALLFSPALQFHRCAPIAYIERDQWYCQRLAPDYDLREQLT
jgi:hypothetical protein